MKTAPTLKYNLEIIKNELHFWEEDYENYMHGIIEKEKLNSRYEALKKYVVDLVTNDQYRAIDDKADSDLYNDIMYTTKRTLVAHACMGNEEAITEIQKLYGQVENYQIDRCCSHIRKPLSQK